MTLPERPIFAAIRQYEIGAGSVEDLGRIAEAGLANTLSEQPGFLGYHLIASGADEVVSVTLFEGEEQAVHSNELAARFVRDRLQAFQLNVVSAISGEVMITRSTAG